jgi:hypothetical protein
MMGQATSPGSRLQEGQGQQTPLQHQMMLWQVIGMEMGI